MKIDPGKISGLRQGNEKLIKISSSASGKIFKLIEREEKGDFLRIRITGGGCNGLSYKMKFVSEPRDGDIYVLSNDVKVLVDTKTALYLKGTLLEYSDKLVAGGFKFSNPNAKASCSCGESFNL
jgi:iron-sulfur cluster assembly protein